MKKAFLILLTLLGLAAPLFAYPWWLQTDNPEIPRKHCFAFSLEGGYEWGAIPDAFATTRASWAFANRASLGIGLTGAHFTNQDILQIPSAIEASLGFLVWEKDGTRFMIDGHALLHTGAETIMIPYTGNLGSVTQVISPRAQGGYDLGGGISADFALPKKKWNLHSSIRATWTADRNLLVPESELDESLPESLRLQLNMAPSIALGKYATAGLQNRIVWWLERGFAWEVLPQLNINLGPEVTLAAGAGVPLFGGNDYRLLGGIRYAPAKPWAPNFKALGEKFKKADKDESFKVIREKGQIRIRVYFFFLGDRADLFEPANKQFGPKNRELFAKLVKYLEKYPYHEVIVEGHTNRINFKIPYEEEQKRSMLPLAQARARSVMNELIKAGFTQNHISTLAVGGDKPLAEFTDKENAWRNRRVEIILRKQKGKRK